jgi:Na+-driven multidrug efflux pump
VGAKKYNRILRGGIATVLAVVAGVFLLSRAALYFKVDILRLWTDNRDVIKVGIIYVNTIMPLYFLCAIMDIIPGMIRGLGYSVAPTIISLIGICVVRIIWVSTYFQIPAHHTIQVVYTAYPISWVVTGIAQIICLAIIWVKDRQKRAYEMSEAGLTQAAPGAQP